MRALVPVLLLVGVSLQAPGAFAQQATGLPQLPGVQAAQAANDGQSFGSDAAMSSSSAARASIDASGLVGLKEPQTRQQLTLTQLLDAASTDNPDLRMSAERLVQAEAGVRRAWALFLPQLSLSGSYTHTCTGGGADGVNCADRTTSLANPDQIEAQADVFEGIADLLLAAADQATDPDTEATLRQDASDLQKAANDTRNTSTRPIVVQPASVWSGGVIVQLPIFNARSFPLLFNAYTAQDVADAARDQVRASLLFSVARAYFSATTAKKLVTVAAGQLKQNEAHLEATKARVEAQTQPPLAQKRAELEVLRSRQQLENARASYDTGIAALGLLIGRDEAFDVVEGTALPTAVGTVDELADKAVEARPDLKMQRGALAIAERQVTDAWFQFLPSLNLVGRASASSFTSGFVRDPITGTVTLTATLPLYDGGSRYAAMRDSSSKVREEGIRLRQLEDRVRAQVRGNARDIAVREQSVALSSESVAVARVAVEQAQAMFEAGVGTSLDVSDTQLRLYLAETDLLRAELDLALARAGLAFVSGTPLHAPSSAN